MKKFIIFTLIALIALFAACVEPAGRGIRIEVKVNSPLKSNQETVLMVILFNNGDAPAKNIQVELSGLSDRWLVDGKPFEGTAIKEVDEIPFLKEKEMKGPLIQWNLKAPSRETSFDYSYKIKVRYDYETSYEGVIKVVSASYFTEKNEKGAVKGNVNSRAPVTIEILAPEENKELISRGTSVLVKVVVKNVGGGEIVNDRVKVEESRKIRCQTNEILFERKEGKQAKVAEIYCNLQVEGLDYETVEPVMKISYRYEILKEGKIRVEPLLT